MKRVIAALCLAITFVSTPVAQAKVTERGDFGQTISIKSSTITKKSNVTVTGKNFDETVGIYLAYCVMPKSGGVTQYAR